MPEQLAKYPNVYDICAKNINKIPEFCMIRARKVPEFYIIIARKIFFPNFGDTCLLPTRLIRLCCILTSLNLEVQRSLIIEAKLS